MKKNWKESLQHVLKSEGGWSDNPNDPGGATMKGITLGTYRTYINPRATKEDLKNISDAHISMLYKKFYWDKVRGDELPSGLDYAMFDFAVNSGPHRAVRYLQQSLDVVKDGVFGPVTLAAARKENVRTTITELNRLRLAFLTGLNGWKHFGKGWISRIEKVQEVATSMAKKSESYAAPFAPLAWLNPFNWR